MTVIVGMDEAGYGPNLGPLVLSGVVWSVPEDCRDVDLWKTFAEITSSIRSQDRLQVGDSKAVYKAGKSMSQLECTVLCLLGIAGHRPQTLEELCTILAGRRILSDSSAPWLQEQTMNLPLEANPTRIEQLTKRWSQECSGHGVSLLGVRSDIVTAERFNRLIREYDNKSLVLSRASLALLSLLCSPASRSTTYAVCDKHGGRNRYEELLAEVFGQGVMVPVRESAEMSCYRGDLLEVRFQARAESEFSVALASMISKYVRELVMLKFNTYWAKRIPGLRPTRGYPVDAKRFRAEVEEMLVGQGIPEDVFWRSR